jgi:hypothetical protein
MKQEDEDDRFVFVVGLRVCCDQGASVRVAAAAAGVPRFRSVFRVPGMDCPAEEVQIRAALGSLAHGLGFDLPGRRLTVATRCRWAWCLGA